MIKSTMIFSSLQLVLLKLAARFPSRHFNKLGTFLEFLSFVFDDHFSNCEKEIVQQVLRTQRKG